MPGPDLGARDEETAYAKINLALHVRRRLPDGYHELETIFAFLDRGDGISVQSGESISLQIDGPFADGLSTTDNLILRAANRLAQHANVKRGAHLHLDKMLPVASGIGGGSADAAATLRLLNRFWQLDLPQAELADVARPLGADVPACLASRTCRGTGIGQDLERILDTDLRGTVALLVNPLVPVSTAAIFAAWDGVDRGALESGSPIESARNGRNDLQDPAIALVPELTGLLRSLEECQPIVGRMSGSGATCFALFDSVGDARMAERHCRKTMDRIWTMIGEIR
ncbi:4-(cytidine 5'-diphospho)-2-C-methyl-D-erythritol kinase [Sphingorhabdus sp. SMR4y]|uniref:4-(cytidine 5'-diphospho)-2-C-methyl-D-erythritol kinase n=1 Tax=Sphingorhabdus sp. SMR4y TaxID=2584094 RepID=UPI000B5CCBD6|nr:4-(cytidine 5'-diphospho)-2-C-methyl-D-erythritol kinase [Sphingorhabdus sp. SMR4y]ASK87622.1 4-diphosphocytidyl-2-C-methyl-D-erythritol kinase [Sphingorhabdus sp. SMR4y]